MKENKKVARSIQDLIKEHHVDDILEGESIIDIEIAQIKANPYQPRRIFNEEKIAELASSIKEHGVFQPIIVKKVSDGYMIVAGERRFRASKQVGLDKIPAIVRAYQEEKVAEIALVENLQREDLTAIEEANAYLNVMQHLNLTQQELALRIGKSRAHITNILGLLSLPDPVQEMILRHQISMGHARALSKLDNKDTITKFAKQIVRDNLSVRKIEEMTSQESKTVSIKRKSKNIVSVKYEKLLQKKYNVKAKVFEKKIVFEVNDETLLEDLIRKFLDE